MFLSFSLSLSTYSIHAHAQALVGIHTPFLRVGIKMEANIRSNHNHKADVEVVKGKKCSVKYNIPQKQTDVLNFK